jgi:hypothetical protein
VDDPVVPYDPRDPLPETREHPSSPGVPGAIESVRQWQLRDACAPTPVPGASLNLVWGLGRDDTSTVSYSGCRDGTSVGLWTLRSGGISPHVPLRTPQLTSRILDFLLGQRKTVRLTEQRIDGAVKGLEQPSGPQP